MGAAEAACFKFPQFRDPVRVRNCDYLGKEQGLEHSEPDHYLEKDP